MQIDEIREQIAELISNDMDNWNDVLNDTSPGNYGCDHWDAQVDYNDIFVNIPEKTFTVKNGGFSANLILGSSTGDSSFNESYNKPFSATGEFDFESSTKIIIIDIKIDIDSDIYSED
jgi:hypothetical protein